MRHLQDYYYKGQKVSLYKDEEDNIAVDVREDDTDGDLIGGIIGFRTRPEARAWAEEFIDKWQADSGCNYRCEECDNMFLADEGRYNVYEPEMWLCTDCEDHLRDEE